MRLAGSRLADLRLADLRLADLRLAGSRLAGSRLALMLKPIARLSVSWLRSQRERVSPWTPLPLRTPA